MARTIRVMAEEATYSLLSDGAIVPAFGVQGGLPGAPVGAWVEKNGVVEAFDTPGKVAGCVVPQNGCIHIRSAGGGGYGSPLERDPGAVLADFHEGLISRSAVMDVYGVVLKQEREVDVEATNVHREKLRKVAGFKVTACTDAYEHGRVSRRRVCRINPRDAQSLGIPQDALVELDGGQGAPIRAWIKLDETTHEGTLPLDEHGRAMLRLPDADGVVMLRAIPNEGRDYRDA